MKGADPGPDGAGRRIRLDFNYAYNPSCAYDAGGLPPRPAGEPGHRPRSGPASWPIPSGLYPAQGRRDVPFELAQLGPNIFSLGLAEFIEDGRRPLPGITRGLGVAGRGVVVAEVNQDNGLL